MNIQLENQLKFKLYNKTTVKTSFFSLQRSLPPPIPDHGAGACAGFLGLGGVAFVPLRRAPLCDVGHI